MSMPITRRDFLARTGGGAAAAASLSTLGPIVQASALMSQEPIQITTRPGKEAEKYLREFYRLENGLPIQEWSQEHNLTALNTFSFEIAGRALSYFPKYKDVDLESRLFTYLENKIERHLEPRLWDGSIFDFTEREANDLTQMLSQIPFKEIAREIEVPNYCPPPHWMCLRGFYRRHCT